MEYVVFAIDQGTETHSVAKFLRHIDTQRAMGNMKGNMVHAIGSWKGNIEQRLEPSYILCRKDYEEFVVPLGYTSGQESVMVTSQDTRQPARLLSADLSEYITTMLPVREVSAEDAMQAVGWTYNLKTNKYFVA